MELHVTKRSDNITQVSLIGSLDADGTHRIDVEFYRQTVGQRKPTIVDLTGLDFLDSIGVGLLLTCAASLKSHARMVLMCPVSRVGEVLDKGRVDLVIPVVRTVDEAKKVLETPEVRADRQSAPGAVPPSPTR